MQRVEYMHYNLYQILDQYYTKSLSKKKIIPHSFGVGHTLSEAILNPQILQNKGKQSLMFWCLSLLMAETARFRLIKVPAVFSRGGSRGELVLGWKPAVFIMKRLHDVVDVSFSLSPTSPRSWALSCWWPFPWQWRARDFFFFGDHCGSSWLSQRRKDLKGHVLLTVKTKHTQWPLSSNILAASHRSPIKRTRVSLLWVCVCERERAPTAIFLSL